MKVPLEQEREADQDPLIDYEEVQEKIRRFAPDFTLPVQRQGPEKLVETQETWTGTEFHQPAATAYSLTVSNASGPATILNAADVLNL